jgi:hypothetical protein
MLNQEKLKTLPLMIAFKEACRMPDIRKMYDSESLRAWDLDGKDVTVTIERIEQGEFGAWNKKDPDFADKGPKRMAVLFFKGAKKGFGCNPTNREIIAEMLGTHEMKDWIGKRITLYPTKTPVGRKMKDCIRVRPKIPE